jgi:hypothetical protein
MWSKKVAQSNFNWSFFRFFVLDVAVPDVGKSQLVGVGTDRAAIQATGHRGGGRDISPDCSPGAVDAVALGTWQTHRFYTSRTLRATSA